MKIWTVRIRYLTFLFEFLRQNWTKMVCSLKLLWAFKYCLNERKVAWLKTKCSVLIAYVIFQAVAHLSSSAAKPVEIKVKIHLTQNKNLKLKKLAKIRWETGGVQFGTKSAIAWQLCPLQLLLIWRRNRRI